MMDFARPEPAEGRAHSLEVRQAHHERWLADADDIDEDLDDDEDDFNDTDDDEDGDEGEEDDEDDVETWQVGAAASDFR